MLASLMMRGNHSLTGTRQSGTTKVNILFYFYSSLQISMWFTKTFILSLLGTNTSLYMGNIKSPPNDPFSARGGTLSTNQVESDLLCSCTCIRRPQQ